MEQTDPPTADDFSTQWLAQMQQMQKTLELLDPPPHKHLLSDPSFHRHSPTAFSSISSDSENDIWDLVSDDSNQSFTENPSELPLESNVALPRVTLYDYEWLNQQCLDLAKDSAGINCQDVKEHIVSLLTCDLNIDEVEMFLVNILGFSQLDLVSEILNHRKELSESLVNSKASNNAVLRSLRTRAEKEEALRQQDIEHKSAHLPQATKQDTPVYPHVYKSPHNANTLSIHGKKYALPAESKRTEFEKFEEYVIPATPVGTLAKGQKLVDIAEMDGLCRKTFSGYTSLNRMQSLVHPVAYHTSENMLICAPTGAGKTDAAMLTILQTIARNVSPDPTEAQDVTKFEVHVGNFKIVYVAPMKALAAEVTEKVSRRLSWLGIKVRELTGDMHLTKSEIVETQVIVTTPEKWDVVTRKSTGDTELVQKVRLLIIDEVHMLHDERGAVLEALVARTQRQVESTQSLIRIIGLSATLPNYIDVADFLKVNRTTGLFYFDASFRPVPLQQHFIGVKGKTGSKQSKENLEEVTFEKVRDMLLLGHQVMVFVHSRKDTFKTASSLYEKASASNCTELFNATGHPGYGQAARDIKSSKARELRELLPKAMGTHHAGMARADRNLVERLFAEGMLKVLCCTATLAWGVNLPAAAVIIKGTQLYSAELGKFVDLGILDVLQIFGRAGRPQFQDSGIGLICTTHDKLQHYLSAVTHQQPIESRFSKRLGDSLNAEIALGTVSSIPEAVQWLGYSYLFVRMQRNPLQYGIDWAEKYNDPQLVQRRRHLIIEAAKILQQSQMIIFNEATEEVRAKDVGRIASQFYVLQTSVQIFNTMMRPRATDADALKMISMSGEFDNVQSRENEANELMRLQTESVPCEVNGNIETSHAKVNILLQSHISRARIEDFTLFSDTAYVAQNSARICRSLFMIALNRRWGFQCLVLLSLCKSIEKQVWPFQHPLHQFDLPQSVLRHLDEKGSIASIQALRDMDSTEIGDLVHNRRVGLKIKKLLASFPTLSIEAEIAPLNRDVLRVHLFLTQDFKWNDLHHGHSELFWIWIENSESSEIYHHEQLLLTRKKTLHEYELTFTIPISDPAPSQIYVRAVSDRWLGAETVTAVSFQHLIRPDTESAYTDLLSLQPIPISALQNPILEAIYSQRFHFFNPMQSQVFHCMYHTSANVLLGSPTGSGKTVAAELAMWWAFREKPGSKVVYIAPMKALVRERVHDWQQRLAIPMGLKLVELTGDNTPDTRTIREADVIITTPEKWDGISRSWRTRDYVRQVSLVIIDEVHLLGGDRGPILEIIVSRMNYIASQKLDSVRLVGMSTACANALDLGNWLGVREGLFNFRHSVRPVPLEIFIDGFPEQRGFCPFMQSMNRPTFLAIKSHSLGKPVIVFVASRRQTRLTARDLINFCGIEENPRRFLHMAEEDLDMILSRVKDEALREALSFGIGLHHAGLVESDRQLAEELFANNKIQVLVATSTLAWGVNLPAHLVVVKGTQFFDAKTQGYKDMDLTDVLQMLGRAGRPQFDSSGIARIFTQESKKAFYKHFLHTGFPVESSLHNVLDNHLAAEISAGTISSKQDALDYLTWTFFFRRIHKNPSFYGLELASEERSTAAQEHANSFMVNLVEKSLHELEISKCAEILANGDVESTPFGKIMSYYYLSHKTIRNVLAKACDNASFEDLLEWISKAVEYDELPVRHNEDLINEELSKILPIDGKKLDLPLGDPHVKAFLLLQAHFSRIDLPISDYVGDQISVLDQSIRIVQASIDILAEVGYRKSCVNMMKLLQCIKSARWLTDSPFSIFPGFNENLAHELPVSTLKELCEYLPENFEEASASLRISKSHHSVFIKAAKSLPLLNIRISSLAAHQLTVEINRRNEANPDFRMYSPRFPKPQIEAFFILIHDSASGELVALKRVGWYSEKDSAKLTSTEAKIKAIFKLPEHDRMLILDIQVISDGYIDMEWKIEKVRVPVTPSIDKMV